MLLTCNCHSIKLLKLCVFYDPNMKIVDAFTFNNEIPLLKYRLLVLYPYVDHVVLVEATRTFTNLPKPLYYQEHEQEIQEYLADMVPKIHNVPYANKVHHVVVDDMPEEGDAWNREGFQRNCIDRGVCKLDLDDDDVILVQDLDEIPGCELMQQLVDGTLQVNSVKAAIQELYYYNLECFVSDWRGTVFINYAQYKAYIDQHKHAAYMNIIRELRNAVGSNDLIRSGWHLSYFGSPSFIQTKLQSFSHTEYNFTCNTDLDIIADRIARNMDVCGRSSVYRHIPLKDNLNLPPYHEELMKLLSE